MANQDKPVTLLLKPAAERDLEKIYLYGLEHFGRARTQRYVADIDGIFQFLRLHPQAGRDCSSIRSGVRASPVKSHIIFYQFSRRGITVIRILHKSMLARLHL